MAITQEQLDQLEKRLQQTIDEKVSNLRTELISEARNIVEQYQRNDRTASRLQDALDKIKSEVLRTVRTAVSTQVAQIRSQQERDLSQLTSTVTSTISDKLRQFKSEVSEYTASDRGSARDAQVVSLEQQIKFSLQQLDTTSQNFQQQMSSILAAIRKDKSDTASRASETALSQAQVDEEERKIRHLQAEITARESQLKEEKEFLQKQTDEFMKEKRAAERTRANSRRYGQDQELERSMLKEMEAIRRGLGSSVATEVGAVIRELREEVQKLQLERQNLQRYRDQMMRNMMMQSNADFSGFPPQPSMMGAPSYGTMYMQQPYL